MSKFGMMGLLLSLGLSLAIGACPTCGGKLKSNQVATVEQESQEPEGEAE